MRPVVASVNTPSSQMSKYLARVLGNLLIDDSFNIKNSYTFKHRLSEITLDEEDRLVSFDIVSLFTNIPINLAMSIIRDRWEELKIHTSIPREYFYKLLEFCLVDANYFVYNSEFYKQIYGMPMGNPLSSVIADIVTQNLLKNVVNKLSPKPRMLVKYVDDIFAILHDDKIEETLDSLNSFHNRLKFTVEHEMNHSLPFLDVLVIRDKNGKLATNWYHKSNASNRMLNYYSNHPENQKVNTAYNLVNRILTLSSDCYYRRNIDLIYNILISNNYPESIIKRVINSYRQKGTHSNPTQSPTLNNTQTTYKSLTYIKGLSEKVNKIVKTYNNNIKIAHKSNVRLQNIFTRLKEKTPKNRKTNIIYEIPCLGTGEPDSKCTLTYVGQTKQYLEKRMKNHKNDLKKTFDPSLPNTAVVQHFHELGHYPDFTNTKILGMQKHYTKRLTMEALYIYTHTTYNQRRDVQDISNVYCAIIENSDHNGKRKRDHTNTYNCNRTNPHKRRRMQ